MIESLAVGFVIGLVAGIVLGALSREAEIKHLRSSWLEAIRKDSRRRPL